MADSQQGLFVKLTEDDDEQEVFAAPAPPLKTKAKTKAKMKTASSDTVPPTSQGGVLGGRASFLVKIWRADDAASAVAQASATDPAWRGVVEHIQSGSKLSFRDEGSLFRFMTEQAHRQHSRADAAAEAAPYLMQPDE